MIVSLSLQTNFWVCDLQVSRKLGTNVNYKKLGMAKAFKVAKVLAGWVVKSDRALGSDEAVMVAVDRLH